MIIDVGKFISEERKNWDELETFLNRIERDPDRKLDLAQLKRFHYLYERASADLAKIATFATEREIRKYLEQLVARAYGEIHESREKAHRLRPLNWFFRTFPQTFRRHVNAFWLAVMITIVGSTFGGVMIAIDSNAKEIILPFSHLQQSPSERVAKEEHEKEDRLAGKKTAFSSMLMTHNARVSILTLALGMTYGFGTILMLFYNGVILGAVAVDYILDGQTPFLMGWLLPHGVVEIPSILIAGQAGLLLASSLIGRGQRQPLGARLRSAAPDLVTLITGVAILLIWAGIIEAFLSQYHEPVIPYWAKIIFGMVEAMLLTFFLSRAGRS